MREEIRTIDASTGQSSRHFDGAARGGKSMYEHAGMNFHPGRKPQAF
jgi:hypothetical protein